MTVKRNARIALVLVMTLIVVGGFLVVVRANVGRTQIVAYFDNSNGLFQGDEVRILGVPVGAIERIEPSPTQVKITFWVDDKYKVPQDVKAAVLSPQLITSRAIQLTPPYNGGPQLRSGGVIPLARTAVPVEWDELRTQLEKLADSLQPTQPGGVSSLGALINTAAGNLAGQGANIRDTVLKLSQAFSILGDRSTDTFATIKNLSVVVAALKDSSSILTQLNVNLAAVTGALANDPGAIGNAVSDLNAAVESATSFIAENKESLGTTSDKLSSITQALVDSIGDVKQALHVFPNAFSNYINIFKPAQGALTGAFALGNFANPVSFLCGAIQAASRAGAEQSAKLCVQYLAPIIKNRQINFLPLGENFFVNTMARPNEITYSEDRLRPDYVPPQPAPQDVSGAPVPGGPAYAAEAPVPPGDPGPAITAPAPEAVATDPGAGLTGMMVPADGPR
jgi:phospholipid/cholesterol/gamma-HCH transport system substrate-binding protein